MTAWWREAVVYEVYVRSFADADGDGLGDLEGVRSRLGYLAELGVDALWLTPFYRSPQADHGYDVADPRDVDPLFGDLAAFDRLVADAHGCGLRVVVDVVPNHVSASHQWFLDAVSAGAGSAPRGRFHFVSSDGPPNGWTSMFGGPAWTQVEDGQWYLHLFDAAQPDLRWDDPSVRADFEETLRFWLDRGVDGFRVDVAGGLVKAAGYPDVVDGSPHPHWGRPEVHEVYRGWRRVLDAHPGAAPGERLGVAEVWGDPRETAEFARPSGLGQVFAFPMMHAEWSVDALRSVVDAQLAASVAVGALPAWLVSSHDFVRPATRLGLERSLALHLLLLALPGAFYLYQGDELGLPEVDVPGPARQDPTYVRSGGREPGRDGARVPLPWTCAGPSYGFSGSGQPPESPWLPQPAEWGSLSVAAQSARPCSPLSVLRRALGSRRELWRGDEVAWLDVAEGCLGFRRGDAVCVVNVDGPPVPLDGLPGTVVCASRCLEGELPADTTAWLTPGAG